MNTHTGTLTRVEARRTIAHRRRHWVAVLRAAMHPEDVERLRADAKLAVEQLAPGSYFQSAALRPRTPHRGGGVVSALGKTKAMA